MTEAQTEVLTCFRKLNPERGKEFLELVRLLAEQKPAVVDQEARYGQE